MATPQDAEGDEMAAMVEITFARRRLLQASTKFKPDSKNAKLLRKVGRTLTRVVGKDDDDAEELSPALTKFYLSDVLGPKAPPPQQPQAPAPQQPTPGAQPLGPGAPMGGMAPQ